MDQRGSLEMVGQSEERSSKEETLPNLKVRITTDGRFLPATYALWPVTPTPVLTYLEPETSSGRMCKRGDIRIKAVAGSDCVTGTTDGRPSVMGGAMLVWNRFRI